MKVGFFGITGGKLKKVLRMLLILCGQSDWWREKEEEGGSTTRGEVVRRIRSLKRGGREVPGILQEAKKNRGRKEEKNTTRGT